MSSSSTSSSSSSAGSTNSANTVSFDDLQYSGVDASLPVTFYCPTCLRNYTLPAGAYSKCPIGHILAPPESTNSRSNRNVIDFASLFPSLQWSAESANNNQFGSENGIDLIREYALSNGRSMEEILQSLLTDASSQSSTPTSKEYIQSLTPQTMKEDAFIQLALSVNSLSRDFLPTIALFGPSLSALHGTSSDSAFGTRWTYDLTYASPISGKSLSNAQSLANCVVIMNRGVISFVEKARIAQSFGAKALLVCQTASSWPYVMSDSTNSAQDILIPAFMINERDAQSLSDAMDKSKEVSKTLQISLRTRHREHTCIICTEDMSVGTEQLTLPCQHLFHPTCIIPWLEKCNVCPMCRYKLPTDGRTQSENERREEDHKALHNAMFT